MIETILRPKVKFEHSTLNSIDPNETPIIIKKLGADIDTSITKSKQIYIARSAPNPSEMEKMQQPNSEVSNIRIIYEEEFLKMCRKK